MEENEVISNVDAEEILDRLDLATMKRVKSLAPITGKDRVELCELTDCGFTCVVERGLHTVGDLVVFIKYDTVVPKTDLFSFMESFKYRVKPKSFTLKDGDDVVGKIYSQGIVLPLAVVRDYMIDNSIIGMGVVKAAVEGDDLTKTIGVTKYIPPVITGAGSGFGEMRRKGDFPSHLISKTDELNLANKTRLIDELQGKTVYITLKIEGSSSTDLS
jgi:RNA ligase (TIGR02306 family)